MKKLLFLLAMLFSFTAIQASNVQLQTSDGQKTIAGYQLLEETVSAQTFSTDYAIVPDGGGCVSLESDDSDDLSINSNVISPNVTFEAANASPDGGGCTLNNIAQSTDKNIKPKRPTSGYNKQARAKQVKQMRKRASRIGKKSGGDLTRYNCKNARR